MADTKPQSPMDGESKKDTVRINLPPGVTGKPPQKPGSATQPVSSSSVTQPLPTPPPPVKPQTPDVTQPISPPGVTQQIAAPGAPSSLDEVEAKKETAVMGKPPATPAPKADTSRVQVPGSKPTVPEMPRPTVKLRREGEAISSAPAATTAPAAAPIDKTVMAEAGPSGGDVGLAVLTMLLSLAVVGYLAFLYLG